jgi:hypothetical protein
MRHLYFIIAAVVLGGMLAGTAFALDLESLDRVSVLMTRDEVVSRIGQPEQVIDAGHNLKAEIYPVKDMEPMMGTGCIYREDGRLAGQIFMFRGKIDREAAERLKKHGFVLVEETDGGFRLTGKDDDTGQPILTHITATKGMTVVSTFEKTFYDRVVK